MKKGLLHSELAWCEPNLTC